MSGRIAERIGQLPARLVVAAIWVYQWGLSPLLGRHCRFCPSCSQYFLEAVRKYGAVSGSIRGLWRIVRCNPLSRGGYDPP